MELHLSSVFLLLLVSWQGLYLAKSCRPDFINSLRGDSNSGPILAPGIYWSLTGIMAPPQAISILSYICSCLLLMVSWQVQPRPAGLTSIMASAVTRIVAPFLCCLFESDSNNIPFPGHLNIRWSYICSCLLPMVSWQVHIWLRAAGLTSIMASKVTRIVASFWAPSIYSSLARIWPLPRPFQY